ncbi:MAG TPA: methyltransferase domain-containing protein [Rhodanobacter sp.]
MKHTPDEPIVFHCNICDRENHADLPRLTREDPSCSKCGSNVRLRSIVQILTTELFGHSLRISEIPRSADLAGIGLSCWNVYADLLARKLRYQNTFYHREPYFDVTRGDPAREGTLDFVIASDVFEHVNPPVSTAFENTRKLLKPDGVFIFSVPFSDPGGAAQPTLEHFPELHEHEIQLAGGHFRLKNTTRDGEVQYFDDLVFHGGPGSTLEMRLFSEWSAINELEQAGFMDITIYSGSDLRHGIYWPDKWSVPMAARLHSRR